MNKSLIPARSFASLACITLIACVMTTPLVLADDLGNDVKAIKKTGSPKVLRCVLNGNPRSLAIQLSDGLAVGYDTWHGGIFTIWKPAEPHLPLNLNGAVYTGAHGPQPTTNGTTIFENKSSKGGQRYHCSGTTAKLHYLGHKIDKHHVVTLSFAFRDAAGKQIAQIEDSAVAGKNRSLYRRLKVSGLAKGLSVKIDFPTGLTWSDVTDSSITISSNGTSSYKTTLP